MSRQADPLFLQGGDYGFELGLAFGQNLIGEIACQTQIQQSLKLILQVSGAIAMSVAVGGGSVPVGSVTGVLVVSIDSTGMAVLTAFDDASIMVQ